jgi:hypothetical protein
MSIDKMKPIAIILLGAIAMSGCAVSGGFKISETKNEKRIHQRFTNSKAASIFYQSFFENEDKTKSTKRWSLGFEANFGWTSKVSDNVRLNNAFRAADKNKNGVVSEYEAIAYVESLIKK